MSLHDLPPYVQHLLSPSAYPHAVAEVKLVQTHISYVFLAGDFVYKFKKPVNFGFLDFSTLEKRKYYCQQELLLNRRLCPDIYLDVVSINHEQKFTLNGPGRAVEYGVKMARMPEEKMMGNLIRAGKLTRRMVDDIVTVLEPFYEKAAGGPEIAKFGAVRAVAENILENMSQIERFVGCDALSQEEYDEIQAYNRRFLENEDIFNKRIAAGRIKDCHGDLHSANICLADQVYIYDCIEFNQRFRYGDVANDLAFLAMDLDSFGLDQLAGGFIERFITDSGDAGIREVLNFYKCYRATVRGKIGLLTAHEPEVDDAGRLSSFDQARKYFALAQRYARTE